MMIVCRVRTVGSIIITYFLVNIYFSKTWLIMPGWSMMLARL